MITVKWVVKVRNFKMNGTEKGRGEEGKIKNPA
jgi:hypothetical protein